MKKIHDGNIQEMEQFNQLDNGTGFIYCIPDLKIEFNAIKLDNKCAVFHTAHDKYILAKAYKNCLSIGNHSREFDTLGEIFEIYENDKELFDWYLKKI